MFVINVKLVLLLQFFSGKIFVHTMMCECMLLCTVILNLLNSLMLWENIFPVKNMTALYWAIAYLQTWKKEVKVVTWKNVLMCDFDFVYFTVASLECITMAALHRTCHLFTNMKHHCGNNTSKDSDFVWYIKTSRSMRNVSLKRKVHYFAVFSCKAQ